MSADIEELTAEEAAAAIARCGFRCDDGRVVVHCFLGSFGADWDVESALELAAEGRRWAWVDSLFGRCLGIEARDRVYVFDTVKPERSA